MTGLRPTSTPSDAELQEAIEQAARDPLLKTSFPKYSRERATQLIYRGWWLTGANISKRHRLTLSARLPDWREL